MSSNIVINSSHWDKNQNKFIYRLTIPQKFEKKEVGLASLTLYNQFYNVSSDNSNNKVSIKWINGITYEYTIPNGYYSISDLNTFLQNKMIIDKLYLIKNSDKNVYFVELLVDANRYGSTINTYVVPTSAEMISNQWTKPSNSSHWDLPNTSTAPQIIFNSKFGKLLGFEAGTYPSTIQYIDTQSENTLTPEISVVNSLIFRCNLINNINITPTDCLSSMGIKKSFGDQMEIGGGYILYSEISTNIYNQIELTICDQNLKPIKLIDTDCTIILSIKNK